MRQWDRDPTFLPIQPCRATEMHKGCGLPRREKNKSEFVHRLKREKEGTMLGTILIVVLVMALLGVLPRWRYSREWGYGPTGGVGVLLLIVVILMLFGRFF